MDKADAPGTGEIDVPVDDCRNQLARILGSVDFEATAREHRFLSYVVEEALSGRGDRIKAYSIAVEVFGRNASFDPQTDPIVRIEAGHLRRSLERYYFTGGRDDRILITIAKGGYVPTFSLRTALDAPEFAPSGPEEKLAAPPTWRRASWLTVILATLVSTLAVLALPHLKTDTNPASPEIPRVLVEGFEDLAGTKTSAAITSGLHHEILGYLSKFRDIAVIGSIDKGEVHTTSPPRFLLTGSVDVSPNVFRLRVILTKSDDGSVLWANSYDGVMEVGAILKAEADIARNVATSVAQNHGAIFQADAALVIDNAPDDWAAYSCTLQFYAYRNTLDPQEGSVVRACLEEAVRRFPKYATAWGLLALLSIDQVRFSFPFDPATSPAFFEDALAKARRGVELEPTNIRALQAEMSALFFTRQFKAGRKVGEQAMALNPNDTELLGEFGTRLALSGSWGDGCPLVTKARELNPGASKYYEPILALCSYFQNDYPQAVMWISKDPYARSALFHLIAAAIFSASGMKEDAERERVWLEENAPGLARNADQEVLARLGRTKDAEFFIGSLRKTGLIIAH